MVYLRAAHVETSIPNLRQFIQENPLGILTTAISSPIYNLIQSSHIPWVIDIRDPSDENELPRLRGHIARANPQAKSIIDHINAEPLSPSAGQRLQQEVLVLFNGPVHHYVTPKFYTKTKPETGKVVPTWNYSAVQCYGTATVYIDSQAEESSAFLDRQIRDLSQMAETEIMEHDRPWEVDDAPERYIDIMKKNIVGIEIEVTSIGGKFKMSQELSTEDRQGVIKGFEALETDEGSAMARMVSQRGEMSDAAKARKER